MISVCVTPELDSVEFTGDAELRVLVWDGLSDAPAGIERTAFLVPPYLGGPLSVAALAAMPQLEVVQLLSAGVDAWLDRIPKGAVLCSGRGIHTNSTAELAVAGLLSVRHGFSQYGRQQQLGEWQPRTAKDIDGSPILILGAGDIGSKVAAQLTLLGANCTLVGRTARDGVHGVAELFALLPQQDAVVIAIPRTPETDRLVDAPFLAAMRDGAILVNVARGSIVETDALVAEVQTGRISAFLDVTDPEPLPADHPLWHIPNVTITPHVGGGTTGWEQRGLRLVDEQLRRFAAHLPLLNVVNHGY